jgi:hypothetical protein
MKPIILALFATLPFLYVKSQSTEDSVKGSISRFFAAMLNADTLTLRDVFAPTAILQTIVEDKNGNSSVRDEAIGDFLNQVGRLAKGDADERIRFDMIKIDGPLAIAWTPYQLYFKGQFNHCGVDSYQLLRINGTWKIQYIIDTRRKDGCK